MSTTIDAVFENGVFRPITPLSLPEGKQVQVVIAAEESAKTGIRSATTKTASDSTGTAEDLSAEEYEACLDALSVGLDLPVLPPEAYSRESIFGDR
jgi:predicted DNA-binding antitoxin AbrB/MazE fold protein